MISAGNVRVQASLGGTVLLVLLGVRHEVRVVHAERVVTPVTARGVTEALLVVKSGVACGDEEGRQGHWGGKDVEKAN